jgi:GNAT superfamily N-acetyltransferase
MSMGRERAWVQPGCFYVLAMEGDNPIGFVFCVKHARKIVVDSYYTHSKYRHQNIATQLTLRLIALARSQGMKSVHISNAVDSIMNMARKMQSKPRVRIGGTPKKSVVPAEHYRIRDRSIRIFWPSIKTVRSAARVQARRRPN